MEQAGASLTAVAAAATASSTAFLAASCSYSFDSPKSEPDSAATGLYHQHYSRCNLDNHHQYFPLKILTAPRPSILTLATHSKSCPRTFEELEKKFLRSGRRLQLRSQLLQLHLLLTILDNKHRMGEGEGMGFWFGVPKIPEEGDENLWM
ncbi:hypothetical protein Droror1_Dr00025403 [Drosera rotundifolia]